jgi:Xaa-Pro dipeptidase
MYKRTERLRELMDRRGLDALVLRRPANFAWFTGRADNRVDRVAPEGVADIVLDRDGEWVSTTVIEAPRMRDEQVPELEVREHPWHQVAGLPEGRVGADLSLDGALDVGGEIAVLRRTLDPDALARLRAVGSDAADALAEAAAAVEPGASEHEVASALAAACRRRDLWPSVLLVAADERIAMHRHPVPVGATIERRAMLVASAERGGLYANLTRFVELEEPDADLARRLEACGEILARMREEATRPGRSLAEAFGDCRRFSAEAGFPDEWRLHHQGGLTGYGSREDRDPGFPPCDRPESGVRLESVHPRREGRGGLRPDGERRRGGDGMHPRHRVTVVNEMMRRSGRPRNAARTRRT